jgi:protein-tyrosine-phosphatase
MDLVRRATTHAALGDETRLRIVDALWLNDISPLDLRRLAGVDSNLMAHHLTVLQDTGLIKRSVSAGDRRRRYVIANHDRIAPFVDPEPLAAGSVLFICTHNSARSQFAEALFNTRSRLSAQSAGLHPSATVHPKAIKVALEHGIDLSSASPKPYSAVKTRPDLVVSVCDRACEATIPFRARRLHWSVPDPVDDARLNGFRSAFEEISNRVGQLTEAIQSEEP